MSIFDMAYNLAASSIKCSNRGQSHPCSGKP
jgi:hypothetical protein